MIHSLGNKIFSGQEICHGEQLIEELTPVWLAPYAARLSSRQSKRRSHGQGDGSQQRLLRSVAYSCTAPVSPLNVNRCRNVMHDLSCVAAIRLQKEGEFMRSATLAHRVAENALAAIAEKVLLLVTRQWLTEPVVMRWHVAILGACNGIGHRGVANQTRLLNRWRR